MNTESRSNYRLVVRARTVLLLLLVALAGAFAVAVALDGEDGDLLDEEGVVDETTVETAPGN